MTSGVLVRPTLRTFLSDFGLDTHSRRGEKRADRGPREEGSGGVRGCTLRSPDNRVLFRARALPAQAQERGRGEARVPAL